MIIQKDSVLNITVFKNKRIIKMVLSDRTVLKFTADHPFWVVKKGWAVYDINFAKENGVKLGLKKIRINDKVLSYKNGNLVELNVVEILDTGEFKDVYNLDHVAKNNTFFAGKVLVHNRKNKKTKK